MNNKMINFIKNFSYTLSSNLISLLISTIVILIIPKLIGIEEYGYWQLYLFYSSYVGFMHFGWNDGIYLRYGGKEYKDLDKQLFFSQFWMLVFSQAFIAMLIYIYTIFFIEDINRIFIFQMIAFILFTLNIRYMLLYILQGTNRIKEYAQITMMDRILYIFLIVVFLIFGVREYKLMIIADLTGKFISLVYAMYCCKDIVFREVSAFYFSLKEMVTNISVGIKLMFANIASMLIIGVVRFGIERAWDVATFGRIALTLSVSNVMMLFINAVGIIIFPILRRTDEKRLPSIYLTMKNFLMVLLIGSLVLYYPLRVILSAWLPKYADSLVYMSLVFPMCVYEGKIALLINTYYNTLRKEKLMLKINSVTLVISLILTFISTIVLKNLNLAIMSIVILLAFRCALSEIILSKILKISVYKDIVLELVMTVIFILTGWFISSLIGMLIYLVTYVIYLFIKRKDIRSTIKNIKLLMKP